MSDSLFKSLRVPLLQYVNVPNLQPHLLKNGLLTLEESERIRLSETRLTSQQLVEQLLDIVVRKGTESERLFLQSLQESISGDDLYVHRGHQDLALLFSKGLQKKQMSAKTSTPEKDCDEALPSRYQVPPSDLPEQFHQPLFNPYSGFVPTYSQYASTPYSGAGSIPYVSEYNLYHPNSSPSLGDFSALDTLDWKEAESMKQRIVVESQRIMRQYSDFVMQVYHLLESLNVDYELVKMKILHMGQPSSSLSMPEVSESKSLKQLITAFHLYSSWFNYEVVKVVAEDFGGKEGIKLVVEYEATLTAFAKKFIFECPQFMPNPTIPPHFEGFVMKVEKGYFSSSAQDLVLFKATIVQLTGIKPYCLLLRSAEEGCIQITWWIPSICVPIVLEKLTISVRILAAMDVKSFYIVGKYFDVHSHLPRKRLSSTNLEASCLSDESSLNAERRGSLDSNSASILTSCSLSTSLQMDSDQKSSPITEGISDSSLISSSDTFGSRGNCANEVQEQAERKCKKVKEKKKEKKKHRTLQNIKNFFRRSSLSKERVSSSSPQTGTTSGDNTSAIAADGISVEEKESFHLNDTSSPSTGLEAIPNPSFSSVQSSVYGPDEETTVTHDHHTKSDSFGDLLCEDTKLGTSGSKEDLLKPDQVQDKDMVAPSYLHSGPSNTDTDFRQRSHSLVSAKTYQRGSTSNNYFLRKRESLYESFMTETSGYSSQKASQLTLCASDHNQSIPDDLQMKSSKEILEEDFSNEESVNIYNH